MTNISPAAQALDGQGLLQFISAATRAVEARRDEINALNVFPVPDGDTGTNMHLTLSSVLDDTPRAEGRSVGEVAAAMARSALFGARGNSGLILAQIFKGMAVGTEGSDRFAAREFTAGLRAAVAIAYQAVENPVEGTMLTVIREVAEAAEQALAGEGDLIDVLSKVVEHAQQTVEKTPEMLDVLRQAGVVDSGGHGIAIMFAGALDHLRGDPLGQTSVPVRLAEAGDGSGAVRPDFIEAVQRDVYGYCTTFVIEGEALDAEQVRAKVTEMGESCVVAGDQSYVKVHLHPLNPGPVLGYAADLGMLSNISIRNMDEQAQEWADARRGRVAACATAVVAVAAGAGLVDVLTNAGTGATVIVEGGDSMNPSVGELAAAIRRAPSDEVVVLPNNKNVIGTAKQAGDLGDKRVRVVPTKTVQAGITALLAFSPEQEIEVNTEAMRQAAAAVRAGAVTRATRGTKVEGTHVPAGRLIGILDDEIVASGPDLSSVALELMRHVDAEEVELVTLYQGADASAEEAARVGDAIRRDFSQLEVEVLEGGQPHYPLLIAVE